MKGTSAEEGSGGSGRPGDDSSGSGPGDRTADSASSAPLPASSPAERSPATHSNEANSRQLLDEVPAGSPPNGILRPSMPTDGVDTHQNQQQPSAQRDQSMQLTATPPPAADPSAVGGVPMQPQEGGSALMEGVRHSGGSGGGDITVDATAGGSRQPSTAFDIFACTQQQQTAQHTTHSIIDPSPVAAAAASADRQPASPSRPFPPSTPSSITPEQQHTANGRQGQTSGSDAVAIMSLAADALLAGDIGPFASHLEKLTTSLPDDDPAVKGLVGSLAKKDKAHRQQGSLGLAGCIVALFKDSSNPSHQSAAASFLRRLCQAGYPFDVERLPLHGVLVDTVLGRRTLPDHVWEAAVLLSKSIAVTAEDLGAFQQHMFCHIDVLVETLVTSGDLAIVCRAYKLIGIMFFLTSDAGALASMCRSVSASPAALGKIATLLKDRATAQWTAYMVLLFLIVPVAMAESGYCEHLIQQGFLSAAMSILQSRRLANDAGHGRSIVSKSMHLINLLIDRETYASCEGLAELMCSQLSGFVARDTARLASAAPDGSTVSIVMGVLDSLASYWDRQLTSGKSKDNPIVECVLQVDLSALSVPPTAASQNRVIQEVSDFFAKFRRRKDVPQASIAVSRQNRLAAALARYSPDMMLDLSIYWECLATSDDVSDLIGFLQKADRLMTLQLMGVDLTQVPDDECAQLADAIGRLPSLLELSMLNANMSPAFIDRLSALLKARPEGDGKGDSSSETVSPPPSSSRDVTRAASTSSAAVPADSTEDSEGTTETGQTADTRDDKKERPFTTLRCLTVCGCAASFNSYLSLLKGLCGRSFETLSLSNMILTKTESEADRYDQLQRVLERLFGTIACTRLVLSFCSVGELSLPVVEDTVMSAATAGLKTNPNRRTLEQMDLPATAKTNEPFLQSTLKDLTLSDLDLSSRVPLGQLISQQFLSSGNFASLVHGAVARAHEECESELRAAREVQERQWAADDARLPPAADAAEEDRRRAAREKREEGLRAEQKEIRSSPPFLLDLRSKYMQEAGGISVQLCSACGSRLDVPLADTSTSGVSFPYKHLQVIEDLNKQYKFRRSVIDTSLDSGVWPFTPVRRSLCRALVQSYDPISPLVWAQTVARKGPSLLLLYVESLSPRNRGPDSIFGFDDPFSVTTADLATYRNCVGQLEALKDAPFIKNMTQEDVDAARTALTEAVRVVNQQDSIGQEQETVHLAALFEKQKRLQVIENLLATLQTKLDDLEAQVQRDKAALSKAGKKGIDSIDRQVTMAKITDICSLTEQIKKNTAAKLTLLEEIAVLQNAMTDVLNESHGVSGCDAEDQPKSRCDVVREELREKLESRKKLKAKQERRMKRQADKEPNEAVSAKMAAEEAAARRNEKDLLRSIGEQVSDDSDDQQRQGEGGGQQRGEGGKKAKKKKRPKTKRPPAAPAASGGPLSSAAAAPSIAADGSPSVREGEGEADGGLELVDSEPSSSPLCGLAITAGACAAMSAASGPLLPPMAPCMPPLPDIGCDSDDLLSPDGVSGNGGGDGLAGQGAGQTDGGAARVVDDGRVGGGEEAEAMRARVAELEAELMRTDRQSEVSRREFQQQLHALQQETLAARREIERLREAQVAGEQTVAETLAANERLQADLRRANAAHRQQLSQQHQRLTSNIDRERSLRQQKEAEMDHLQHHFDRHKRAAAEREASLTQQNTSQAQEIASLTEGNRALQADIDQLRSIQIDRFSPHT
ncbi:unnamed protein product [Vitrella brassicaformis CCMP3155]|uniref:Uncharacterized protein n=1 Tax=Vitrella brassicaformis (strain CCMP3155) TaxID=1169540 RepID=A0A0G4F756_VITBC|nr:unnamed protein product [Vitrella brassicaformis CCMP3155]|eukprot:CEM08074.1 unnamed protein product [Vitrella brassicaformis CCMP3155]